MQVFCQLDGCPTRDEKENEDCFTFHAKVIEKELKALARHYQALKRDFLKNVANESRFEKMEAKYKAAKKRNQELTEELQKAEKRKLAIKIDLKGSKKKSNPMGNIAANNAFLADDSSTSLDGSCFKSIRSSPIKRKVQKENSPRKETAKKKTPAEDNEKMSMALTFSNIQPKLHPEFKRKNSNKTVTSSPKILKQQKLAFRSKPSAEVTRSKTVHDVQARLEDEDETFCDSFLIEKAKTTDWRSSCKSNNAKKSDGLFAFDPLPVRERKETRRKPESPTETSGVATTSKVKQEKFSGHVVDESSIQDMFQDADMASEGSSVLIVETEDQGPFVIEDTVLSDYGSIKNSVNQLERDFFNQTETKSPKVSSPPPRRRLTVYRECRECSEYYDAYAKRHGPTQTDNHIRECPSKCKGYRWRKKKAEPPLPEAHSFVYRNTENQTPEGFWNVSITKTQDDDPDRTQDGL